MEHLPNKSPLSLRQKLFIGFGLVVSIAFLYVNVVVLSQPVREHLLTRSGETIEQTHTNEVPKAAHDTLSAPIPKFKEVIPDLGDVVSIPHIEFGPF